MIKILRMSIMTITVMVTVATARVIEIPLPALLGVYPVDDQNGTRTTTFQLPAVPLVVHGASFRVSGIADVGSVTCEWGGPYAWPMYFEVYMPAPNYAHVWGVTSYFSMPSEAGSFSWTAEFRPYPSSTTWGFLMDGEAEISMWGTPAGSVGVCFPDTPPPTAIVEEAVLIIDADFSVPVEVTDWGRIKVLYDSP